jgi:cyclopropane fatty-acyl-phospholipid synthase-like methyltransferase
MINIPDNWYENFFSGINCEMWEKAVSQEWTDNEAAFLIDVLNVKYGDSILDIPCGTGRLSISLARQGFQLTAVDISEEFIAGLTKKVKEQKLPVEIIQGNILSLSLTGSFDAAFCVGNSFGYFNYAGMKIFVQKISTCLKPGARLVINTGVLAESFLTKFITEKKYELGDLIMEISNAYDVWQSCLLTTLKYTKNGQQETHQFKHHVYTVAEIIRLLSMFDLKTIALYNSVDKTTFELSDAQLYLIAEKR